MPVHGSVSNETERKPTRADLQIRHVRVRPRRPQLNGKVERFNRTMIDEWAYVRLYTSDTERTAALADWLHTYNHHRNHTAIDGLPISRAINLTRQHN